MNIHLWKTGKLFVCILLVFLLALPVRASSTDIKKAEGELENIQDNKKEVESLVQDLNKLKSDTQAYVSELDKELNRIYTRLDELNAQMEKKQTEIDVAKEELSTAIQDEQVQYAAMKLRIQYMYEKNDTGYIDLLLSAGSISELSNRAEYISQISEYDRDMLVVYQETKDSISVKEAVLEEEYKSLEVLKEETKSEQLSVEILISEKTTELEQFDSEISVAETQIEQYQKDLNAQENKIKQIEAEIIKREEAAAAAKKAAEEAAAASKKAAEEEARRNAETASSESSESGESGESSESDESGDADGSGDSQKAAAFSGFIWPCPSSKRVTSEFGSREAPVAGASSYHQGIDIGASSGSNIVAAAAGEVVIATYSYSAGNYIMISHGNGMSTVYMHCSKLLVSVGDYVQQGAVIGLVGSTGYSTGPHLHFGVRVGGVYVNPRKYIS